MEPIKKKKKEGISCESTLSSDIRGRASMKMSAACVFRGHEFNVNYAVSSKQVKTPGNRRKELPVETSLATNTTGREAKPE